MMRRGIEIPASVLGSILAVTLIVGLVVGVWAGVDIERHARATVAVETERRVPPACEQGEWRVLPGDTMWDIAATCFPGEHTGQMVAEIRAANPGVDPGTMRFGDVLVLPERGR